MPDAFNVVPFAVGVFGLPGLWCLFIGLLPVLRRLPLPRAWTDERRGLRSRELHRDPETWLASHRAAGPWMTAAGVLLLTAAALIGLGVGGGAVAVTVLAAAFGGPVLATIGLRRAKTAARQLVPRHATGPDVHLRKTVRPPTDPDQDGSTSSTRPA